MIDERVTDPASCRFPTFPGHEIVALRTAFYVPLYCVTCLESLQGERMTLILESHTLIALLADLHCPSYLILVSSLDALLASACC